MPEPCPHFTPSQCRSDRSRRGDIAARTGQFASHFMETSEREKRAGLHD